MNSWQVNTHRLGGRRPDDESWHVRAYHNAGSRDAVRCLRRGQHDLALAVLFASLEKQARLLGLRDVHLPRRPR